MTVRHAQALGRRFMIKYHLDHMPSVEKLQAWARAVRVYSEGEDTAELAGERAARVLLSEYGPHVCASGSEPVEILLWEAEELSGPCARAGANAD